MKTYTFSKSELLTILTWAKNEELRTRDLLEESGCERIESVNIDKLDIMITELNEIMQRSSHIEIREVKH